MATSYPCFLLPAGWDAERLASCLCAFGSVMSDPATRVERRYLDTEDRRLAAAGAVLQAKRSGDVLGLVYEERDSGKPLSSCRVACMPTLVAELPPGVLRDLLAPIVADRPLAPVASLDSEVGALRVMRDGETVARLLLETGRCSDGRGGAEVELVLRVSVLDARGHQAVAREIIARLAGEFAACPGTRLAQVLAALERAAG